MNTFMKTSLIVFKTAFISTPRHVVRCDSQAHTMETDLMPLVLGEEIKGFMYEIKLEIGFRMREEW